MKSDTSVFSISQTIPKCYLAEEKDKILDSEEIAFCSFPYWTGNIKESIERLGKQMIDLLNNPESDKELYYETMYYLASIYSMEKEYKKSIDLQSVLLNHLMEGHLKKYNGKITRDNIDFEKPVLDKIISLYLGIGASYAHMDQQREAKIYWERGYFFSFTVYGDKDERSLKLSYNLAINELSGTNEQEGVRQLNFVYQDMCKYLGDDNPYTKIAKKMLDKIQMVCKDNN